MSKIAVLAAGGHAGRLIVAEARRRGHDVTAVVRDPDKHADLAADGVAVVSGDVSDPASVAAAVAGHDAVVSAVGPGPDAPRSFLADVTRTILAGLEQAGVERLVAVGGAGSLEVAPGARLVDTPDFPDAYKATALAHADALDALRAADTTVDWVSVSPAAYLDLSGERTGRYRVGGDQLLSDENGVSRISYADYAIAIVDELETPRHHRQRFTVAD